jgi:hypothetical protein
VELFRPVQQDTSLGPHQISGITRHASLDELPQPILPARPIV